MFQLLVLFNVHKQTNLSVYDLHSHLDVFYIYAQKTNS